MLFLNETLHRTPAHKQKLLQLEMVARGLVLYVGWHHGLLLLVAPSSRLLPGLPRKELSGGCLGALSF